jgi:hypothetical protein
MTDPHAKQEQTEHISRRNFLRLCGASAAATALTAYGYRSVPSSALPVSPLPTPAYTNHAYLPSVLNAYSTLTYHVYLPVASKACTNPLPSPRPTEIVFEDDFNHGIEFSKCWEGEYDHWYGSWQKGAQYELVDHPSREQVFKAWVSGERFLEGGRWWRRTQLSWGVGCYESLISTPAPCAVSCDVWLSDTLVFPGDDFPSVGLLSFHTPSKTPDKQPYYSAGFEVWKPNMALAMAHNVAPGVREDIGCDTVHLPINQWFNLMLVIERDGRVLPFFNGKLAISDPSKALIMPSSYDIGLGDAHAGLYCAQPELTPDWEQGAFLLNDNFKVIRFPCG